ncbi:MAG: hypothetical protein RLY35_1758 [Bacteroidota bacterium]|jgi:formiminotetrahydrofolate cyclodeaminase
MNKVLIPFQLFARIFAFNTRAMNTKLTLTIEKNVIEKAKRYAKQTGRSLSHIIEKYLEEISEEEVDSATLSPQLKNIIGSVKLPKEFNEKKAIREYLNNKHL